MAALSVQSARRHSRPVAVRAASRQGRAQSLVGGDAAGHHQARGSRSQARGMQRDARPTRSPTLPATARFEVGAEVGDVVGRTARRPAPRGARRLEAGRRRNAAPAAAQHRPRQGEALPDRPPAPAAPPPGRRESPAPAAWPSCRRPRPAHRRWWCRGAVVADIRDDQQLGVPARDQQQQIGRRQASVSPTVSAWASR